MVTDDGNAGATSAKQQMLPERENGADRKRQLLLETGPMFHLCTLNDRDSPAQQVGAVIASRPRSGRNHEYQGGLTMSYDSLIEARIQFGDTVIVITNEDGAICYQDAIVINTPQGQGDLWQFQRPDESVFALNPYHNSLVRIEKAPTTEPGAP